MIDRTGCPLAGRHPARPNEAAYSHGCRCWDAAAAARVGRTVRRRAAAVGLELPRPVPALRSRRQIEALLVAGWRPDELAREAGGIAAVVTAGWWDGHDTITSTLADRIGVLYDRLQTTVWVDRFADPEVVDYQARGFVPAWGWNGLEMGFLPNTPWAFGWDVDDWSVEVLVKRCRGQYEPLPARITADEVALAVYQVMARSSYPAAALEAGFAVSRDACHNYVVAGGLSELQARRLAGRVRMSSAERDRIAS